MKVTNAKQLGAYLRDERKNQKLSQGAVGKAVGIRQDTVSSFELNPSATKVETLFKILSALELELEIRPRGAPRTDDAGWQEEW